MKRRAHAKQRDRNEPEIVEALRRAGCKVYLQDGPLDLLVGVPRTRATYLLEVKDGAKPPAARPLTPAQVAFFRDWTGGAALVVRSVEEALCVVGVAPHGGRCGCGGVEDPAWFTAARESATVARAEAKKAARKGKLRTAKPDGGDPWGIGGPATETGL